MARYIDADALISILDAKADMANTNAKPLFQCVARMVSKLPAADVVELDTVAEMLRVMFDDECACNYNGNDEWLPQVCEYGCTECPDAPEKNGCWKQFVKCFLEKMDGERKEQT